MSDSINITIYPAETKVQALEKFGAIAIAMSVAHATMLREALYAKTEEDRLLHLKDARQNLEAQMSLAQIEMFIHNIPEATP